MAIIPHALSQNDYKYNITSNNQATYRSEHFHLIEDYSIMNITFCTESLLLEWSCSGRVRPAIGQLKYLLEKTELFRAADYIVVNVLKQDLPRPLKEPAAPVVLTPEELKDPETARIEKILDQINYPSSAIEDILKSDSVDTNLNYITKKVSLKVIPKVVISESPNIEKTPSAFRSPVVIQSKRVKSETATVSNSDNANISILSSLLTDQFFNNNIPVVIDDITHSQITSKSIESNNSEVN